MDAVQRTQIFLLATLSAVACSVYRVNLHMSSVTCSEKTLRSFWPFPSFYCKALAEVMTKWWNLGLCLNAYKKSSKITLQPFLR